MGLNEKLTDRVQPMLMPGEQVQQVFLAQTGNPMLAPLLGLLGTLFIKRRIVAVTDRAVVVFGADFNGAKPTEVLRRLPRASQLGPVKGIWAPINVGEAKKTYVHARFHKAVNAADAAISAS
jgi:hypothetical protein